MTCPSTGPKYLVWAGPNILCQTKIDSHIVPVQEIFVPEQKMIHMQLVL